MGLNGALQRLWRDKLAAVAMIYLILVIGFALVGPWFLADSATKMNLRLRNLAPFGIEHGWLFWLGGDALGRPILARIVVASQNTLAIAATVVPIALIVGAALGLLAGYRSGWLGDVILRTADIIMSFPSLLLAVVVLYVFEPRVANLVFVLAITRVPIYIRATRAEVLELRELVFVEAARALGAGSWQIVKRHILPLVSMTLVTIATVDFAFVMLAESALSFLGIGIQPPEITWGLMVAQGRNYLNTAWWLAFFPGMMIMLTTLALNLVTNWLRTLADPTQRWRLGDEHG